MRWIASFFLFAAALTGQTDSKTWINNGVREFKTARYQQAIAAFQKATEFDPSSVTAHLYLATTYMQQFIPGAESPDNREVWQKSMDEFLLVSMGAILGGTMRSPFTGIIFALELTHDINMLVPLLLAVTIAHGFTVLMLRRSILTEKVARRGYHLSRE